MVFSQLEMLHTTLFFPTGLFCSADGKRVKQIEVSKEKAKQRGSLKNASSLLSKMVTYRMASLGNWHAPNASNDITTSCVSSLSSRHGIVAFEFEQGIISNVERRDLPTAKMGSTLKS